MSKSKNLPDTTISGKGLSIVGLNISYGEAKIISNFSAEFPPKGCICVTGPSGSGKTTLLQAIAGLKKPDSGVIYFNGAPIKSLSYVFQDDRLLPWYSALDNVMSVITGKSEDQKINESRKYLSDVGLSDDMTKHPNELSGGINHR